MSTFRRPPAVQPVNQSQRSLLRFLVENGGFEGQPALMFELAGVRVDRGWLALATLMERGLVIRTDEASRFRASKAARRLAA